MNEVLKLKRRALDNLTDLYKMLQWNEEWYKSF